MEHGGSFPGGSRVRATFRTMPLPAASLSESVDLILMKGLSRLREHKRDSCSFEHGVFSFITGSAQLKRMLSRVAFKNYREFLFFFQRAI